MTRIQLISRSSIIECCRILSINSPRNLIPSFTISILLGSALETSWEMLLFIHYYSRLSRKRMWISKLNLSLKLKFILAISKKLKKKCTSMCFKSVMNFLRMHTAAHHNYLRSVAITVYIGHCISASSTWDSSEVPAKLRNFGIIEYSPCEKRLFAYRVDRLLIVQVWLPNTIMYHC